MTAPSDPGEGGRSAPPSPHGDSNSPLEPGSASPILVVSPTSLLELLRALPVFRSLASAGRQLVVLAPAAFARFLSLLPGVRDLVELEESQEATVAALRKLGCREAVLLDESRRAAQLVLRAGVPRRWGYGGWWRRRLLEPGLERPAVAASTLRRMGPRTVGRPYYRRLVTALGLDPPSSWRPTIQLPEELRAEGESYLRRAQIPRQCLLVGLFAGADHRLSPRWPWQSFAALAQRLRKSTPSVRCALVARSADLWPSVRVHEETARFVPVLGPDLDLADLAGALCHLDLAVGNSGSLLDLATALGVTTLALASPTTGRASVEGQEVLFGRSPTPPLSWVFRRSPLFALEVDAVLERCETLLGKGKES